jgi:hypothetical protein
MFPKSPITAILFFCFIISLPAFSDEPNDLPAYVSGEVSVRFVPQEGGGGRQIF